MKQDRLSRTLGAQFLDPYSGFRTNAVTCPTIADTVPTTNSFWPPSLGSLAAFLRPTDRLHSESCPLCVGLCIKHLEEVRFPIAHVDQPRLRHLGGQVHQITVVMNPDEGLFLLDWYGVRGPVVFR